MFDTQRYMGMTIYKLEILDVWGIFASELEK